MILWILMGALAALVLLVLLRPLLRPVKAAAARRDYELAVGKAQLAELERDREAGLLPAAEAETARLEVERRLLALDQTPATPARTAGGRAAALIVLLLLPATALGLYVWLGEPDVPSLPLSARGPEVRMHQALTERVASLRQTLAENPEEAATWRDLGFTLVLLGRYQDGAEAYRRALALGLDDAESWAGLAEALVLAAEGKVGPEARQALARALERNRLDPLALYYVGHALEQDGRLREALALWRELVGALPPDAPWRKRLEGDIARVERALAAGQGS